MEQGELLILGANMKEGYSSHTSILLPEATVALFCNDDQTNNVFGSVAQDWRFARVKFDLHDGDVETATEYYSEYESPDLIIVQTDKIEDDFSSRLEALSSQCDERTAAVVIGPVNDVDLYRELIGMGVSDYLVRPLDAETFANNIAATLISRMGESDSRLIAVIGAKGGIGATCIAEALAWGVSDQLDQKTFLMDAASGWSTLSVGMNFEPTTTLSEAVRAATQGNEDSLTRMVHKASDNLSILSSGGDVMLDDEVDPHSYEQLIDHFLITHPILIADLSGAGSAVKRTVLSRAHKVIVLTSPVLSSVRATRTLLQEIKGLHGGTLDHVNLVVNMQGLASKQEVPKDQIEEGVGHDVSLCLSYEPAVFVGSESEGKKLAEYKGGGIIIEKILPLVRELVSVKAKAIDGNKGDEGIGALLRKLRGRA